MIDPRFKNHSNVFTMAEQIENIALLEAELSTRENPGHTTLTRSHSNPDAQRNSSIDEDTFGNFLMPSSSEMAAPSTNKSQSSKIKEEIEAFLKVNINISIIHPEISNIGTSFPALC